MAVRIERVAAERTWPLRQQVLRPHERLDELALPGDDDSDAAHVAAVDDDEVIGTASVRRERPSWDADPARAWRLRGMATSETHRNLGVGAALLAAVVDHVGRHGGGLLWCHARTPATRFYERAGFVTRGGTWIDPLIGPHVAMELTVDEVVER